MTDAVAPAAELPRILWMIWFQGLADAPKVVQACHRSWQKHNPDWEIRLLDADAINALVDVDAIVGPGHADLSMPHRADIARINLLAQHGGVWADATTYCNEPLDNWIHDAAGGGFFAYQGHRVDTPMSNWFMASHPGCHLTVELCRGSQAYWRMLPGGSGGRRRLYRLLKLLLNRTPATTPLWLTPFVGRTLGVRPYFWFHYLFGRLLRDDPECRRIWQQAPALSAAPPHRMQTLGLLDPVTDEVVAQLDHGGDHLYKLNWKLHKFRAGCDGNTWPADCTLDYLLQRI